MNVLSSTPVASSAALTGLLRRVAESDELAFAELYGATSARLMGVCLRILRDAAESEEVLQEVYIAVWRGAAGFDPARGASPLTWLISIARYRAIDRLRARAPGVQVAAEDALSGMPDASPSAEDQLSASQAAARLHACLRELEPHVETAIRTAFFEGIAYDSVAQRLGQPTGTVKSWIRRGLLKLRRCLEQ